MKKKILLMLLPALMAISAGTALPTAVFASEGNSKNTKELFNPDSVEVDRTYGEYENPEATWDKTSQTLTIEIKEQAFCQWGNRVYLSTGITTLDTSKEYQFSFTGTASTDNCGGVTFKAFDSNTLVCSSQNLPFTTTPYNYVSEWATPLEASTDGYLVFDFGWDAPQTVTVTNISIKERSKVVSYTISNGTPESAKETNHGYITIDKETAAESETVQITVEPDEGYQLKSLTVTPAATLPAGALTGVFTVSDPDGIPNNGDEKKVHFSQGNLWADGSNVLHFEDAQWKSTPASSGPKDASHVSHFTWSSTVEAAVGNFESGDNLFCDESHKVSVDSGKAIYYALSKDEWTYLFNNRTMTNEKVRYSNAVSSGVTIGGATYKGVFLYPDNYNGEVISSSMTWDAINAAGIVFLPAAGGRNSGVGSVGSVGYGGVYWSSSAYGEYSAHRVFFSTSDVIPDSYEYRDCGYSVRLVTEVKEAVTPEIKTVADVLATVDGEFPNCGQFMFDIDPIPENAWINNSGYVMIEGESLLDDKGPSIFAVQNISGAKNIISGPYLSDQLKQNENAWEGERNGTKFSFNMENDKLVSIVVSNCGTDKEHSNGTYTAPTTITPEKQQDGTYQFTMPGYAVTVTAKFELIHVHAIKTTYAKVEAKCDEAGHEAYYECDCGKYFSDQALTQEIENLETWLAEDGGGYLAPLGHNFGGAVTYTWNEDKCTASWKCQRTGCNETQTEVASLDNGKTVYVMDTPATCLQNEKGHYEATFTITDFEKQSTAANSVVKLDTATGHHFSGDITYTWEGDQCTASWKCDHAGCIETQTETVTGVYVKDSDATTESNEKGHYEATFTVQGFTKQSTAPNSVEKPNTKLSSGLSGGAIAGIVIGSVFGLLIIAFAVLYILWKRKNLNVPILSKVLTPAFRFINKLFFKTKLNDVEAKEAENKAMKE